MGIFLNSIQKEADPSKWANNQLVGIPLYRVKQYLGSFRAVCENFTISKDEWEQIFAGIGNHTYKCWDRENKNCVEALQLFAGLGVFAEKCSFQERLKFLFELVDFNELNAISHIDIEFLLICICNAVFKVIDKFAQVNEQEISAYVEKSFGEAGRFTFPLLMRWASGSEEVRELMRILKKDLPPELAPSKKTMQFKQNKKLEKLLQARHFAPSVERQYSVSTEFGAQYQWLLSITKKIQATNNTTRQRAVRMSWVYGIRCSDIKHPLFAVEIKGQEAFIYFVARVVIVFLPNLNEQRYYNFHSNQIISLDVDEGGLAATGEYADSPVIHIWDYTTCQNKSMIKGVHRDGVHLLKFILKGKLLASAGLKSTSPILVHSVQTLQLLYSTQLRQIAVELFTISLQVAQNKASKTLMELHHSFLVVSLREIWMFREANRKFFRHRLCLQNDKVSCISSAVVVYINGVNPYLKGYSAPQNNSLVLLLGHQKGQFFKWSLQPREEPDLLHKYEQGVSQLKVVTSSSCIALVVGATIELHGLSVALGEFKPLRRLSLADCGIRLHQPTISDISISRDSMMIVTMAGDLFKLKLYQLLECSPSGFAQKLDIRRLPLVSSVLHRNHCMCVFQRTDFSSKVIFTASADGSVRAYSVENRELIDSWTLPEPVTAVDCRCLEEGGIILVAGSSKGRLFVRMDWEQNPKSYECGAAVISVRMSEDLTFMAVCCANFRLLLFVFNNGSFFGSPPKRIQFQNEIPLECQFTDDSRSFLVSTSSKSQFQVQLPDLKSKNLMQENEKVHCSQWSLKYPLIRNKKELTQSLPAITGGDAPLFVAGGQEGAIYFWSNRAELQNNSVYILSGHASAPAKLVIFAQQDKFISLGSNDGCMIEWSISQLAGGGSASNLETSCPESEDLVFRERKFCLFKGESNDRLKEQFALLRGNAKKLPPQISFTNKWSDQPLDKRAPAVSLQLDEVYGYSGSKRRNTLAYMGSDSAERMFATHVSRIIIVRKLSSSTEFYFQAHKFKVSCIAVHPQRTIIASGEAAPRPHIFIYNVETMKQKFLHTAHRKGIVHLAFATGNNLLASFGFGEHGYLLQIMDWALQQILVVKNQTGDAVYSLAFHPHDPQLLFTCGHKLLGVLLISGRNIEKKEHYQCSDTLYFVAPCGDQGPRLFTGGKSGTIFVVGKRGLTVGREEAHSGAIYCGVLMQSARIKFLATGGADGVLRVWTLHLQLAKTIRLHEIEELRFQGEAESSFSIQSLDYISCGENTLVLLGTEDGHILEVSTELANRESTFKLTYHRPLLNCLFARGTTSERVLFAINPKYDLLATAVQNGHLTLKMQDSVSRVSLKKKKPTAIKFCPLGDMLALGFGSGELHFYDVWIDTRKTVGLAKQGIKLSYSFKQQRMHQVLCIQFSPSNCYVAVSYSHNFESEGENTSAFVEIFQNKSNKVQQEKNQFVPLFKIKVESKTAPFKIDGATTYAIAVPFMSFYEGEGDCCYLLMQNQLISDKGLYAISDLISEYVFWNIVQNEPAKSYATECTELKIVPNYLHMKFQYLDEENDSMPLVQTTPTALIKMEDTLIVGNKEGELIFVKENCLFATDISTLEKEGMCLGKTFPAHISIIDCLGIDRQKKYLFSSGLWDECIFRWKIQSQEAGWDLDSQVYDLEMVDPLREVIPRASFVNKIYNVLSIRSEVVQRSKSFQALGSSNSGLKLKRIIGRRAIDRRMNLHYDVFHRWVYSSGCNIVLSKDNSQFSDEQQFSQQFFLADDTQQSCGPEVSCLSLSKDRRFLIAGTCEQTSTILIWNICSHIRLKRIKLNKINQLLMVKFCFDNSHICAYGITQDYSGAVILVEIQSQQILGICNFLQSTPWKVKDIEFLQFSRYEFVTVGVKHFSLWQYKGKTLTYRQVPLDERIVMLNCVISLNDLVLAACEEGYLHIWDRQLNFVRVQKLMATGIRSMAIRNTMVAVGSLQGLVGLYELEGRVLKPIREVDIRNCSVTEQIIDFGVLDQSDLEIQSLSLDEKFVLVGTKPGDIFQICLEDEFKTIRRLSHHDRQPTECLSFSESANCMFSVTRQGLFQMWEMDTFKLLKRYRFNKQTKKMIVAQLSPTVLLAFDKQVQFLRIDHANFSFEEGLQLHFKDSIETVQLSPDQNLVAVSLSSSGKEDSSPVIQIYSTDLAKRARGKLESTIEGLASTVEMMDFSKDGKYLLYRDKFEDITIIELEGDRKISTLFTENEIEWKEEGLQYSEKVRGVHLCYTNQNRITGLRLISPNTAAVSDQMGMIMLFDYPNDGLHGCNSYFAVYLNHLNYINCMAVSRDHRYFATASQTDRSLLIWQIQPSIP